ncbi:hypothetical protein AB6A40_005887 [Gnathostoma spinigerum]|uniref:NADH:flavin oxidoreductase/NADH oxidase N-terminal domain-containing protein n=1 Tax=Gnathostoma spinigerum TaxID=75299 RepID=A0ABD6EGS1_9BILA
MERLMEVVIFLLLGRRTLRETNPTLSLNNSSDCLKWPLKFEVAYGQVAKNRIMKAPMSEMLSTYNSENDTLSGLPTESLLNLYRIWSVGGSGIIVTGSIAVNENYLEKKGNLLISRNVDSPQRRHMFKMLSATSGSESLIIAQLLHPGRNAVQLHPGTEALDMNNISISGLKEIVEEHIYAARFCEDCGFDGIELNVALDFAIAQLVDASTNNRTDDYGGGLLSRTKIIFDIIGGMRKKLSNNEKFIVGMKMHCGNYKTAYNESEFVEYLEKLNNIGLDYITLAGGYLDPSVCSTYLTNETSFPRKNFYCQMLKAVRLHLTNIRVFHVGGFRSADIMRTVVSNNFGDGIAMARALAAEPDLPMKILNGQTISAKDNILERSEFFLSKQAASTQMWQFAENRTVLDLSNSDHVKAFLVALEKHRSEHSDSEDFVDFVKFDIDSLPC